MVSGSSNQPSAGAATPRVATRRVPRFSPRPFSSPLAAVRNVGRPPIVLEWGSSTVLRVGYAEQFQPQHIIPLPQEPFQKLKDLSSSLVEGDEESRWYDVVSPIVRQVFDRLMVDPTTRRVVVIGQPYPVRSWETAMKEALWNLGVPAVAFLNFCEVVPLAQGWKRGLVVHVGTQESHFLAHVDGHPLPFTYQGKFVAFVLTSMHLSLGMQGEANVECKATSNLYCYCIFFIGRLYTYTNYNQTVVPSGYNTAVEDSQKIQSKWDERMEKTWLDEHNPNSLVVGLLKCLKESPTDTRKDLIANIVVCGDTPMIVPDLGRRLALKVKQVLSNSATPETDDNAPSSTGDKPDEPHITFVPVATQQLQPLAEHVGVLSCAPHRADLISWVGGSVYVSIWHRHHDQDAHVPWIFSPATAE